MSGPVVLIGGEGFTEAFEPALQRLRDLAGGADASIVTLPTAAADDGEGVPQQRAKMAVDFLSRLGPSVEAAMVLDEQDANDPKMVEKINGATWIHVQGGQPDVLHRILDGSAVWNTILRRHEDGAMLVGSSAGAVILGSHAFSPRRPFPEELKDLIFDPVPGFGLLPNVAVGPHFNAAPVEIHDQFKQLLPPDVTLVGVDEQTGLLGLDGKWEVIGAGQVTLVRDGEQHPYPSGETVPLFE